MKNTKKLTLSALFLALGLVMPFLTMQIPEVGSMLLPMHIPVLICGFVCGPSWGLIVGFLTPLLRSVTFGMPPMMPTAVCMAFELATYGLVAGLLYGKLKKNVVNTYVSLVGAMLAGRVVWAVVALVVYTAMGSAFTFQMFLAGAFINAIPGIVLQIVAIPVLIVALRKAHLIEEE
ncbi:MAG: ECF transporter S component [Agathobacter sp.]|nr:ECF transporter S component [Agathobacter sp.]